MVQNVWVQQPSVGKATGTSNSEVKMEKWSFESWIEEVTKELTLLHLKELKMLLRNQCKIFSERNDDYGRITLVQYRLKTDESQTS